MSIIPASRLSKAEMSLLGNNLIPAARISVGELEAANRSLAAVGEEISTFHGRRSSSGDWSRSAPTSVKRRRAA